MATVDIREHGAVGDGVTNDAPAIQAAIDAITAQGGGTVVVPAGYTFAAGTIVLKSNVELHVERGATLEATGDLAAYTAGYRVSALSNGRYDPDSQPAPVFITSNDAENIAISGAGTINGGGRHFVIGDSGLRYTVTETRPFTVFLVGSRRVVIRDIKLVDSASWCLRLTGCEDALIHGVTIDTDMKFPNADGIDIDRSRRVRIADCEISGGDDAISLKTCEEFDGYGPTSDVVVTNCTLRSTSSAVVVGVDAMDDISNVAVTNCVIRSSNRGLSVNQGQAGHMRNITFSNCVIETSRYDEHFWGHAEPIYVNCGPWHLDEAIGTIRNVRFNNIIARGESGAYIAADDPGLVEGIVLDGVQITICQPGPEFEAGWYDRRPTENGPEVFRHPTAGIYADTVGGLTIRNCAVSWEGASDTYGHALEAVDVEDLRIEGLHGPAGKPDLTPIVERTRSRTNNRY